MSEFLTDVASFVRGRREGRKKEKVKSESKEGVITNGRADKAELRFDGELRIYPLKSAQ